MIYGWSPKLGDPTFYGWITVVGYLATALLCLRNVGTSRAREGAGGLAQARARMQRRCWALLTMILLFLAADKYFDLESLLTAFGRHIARKQGWYGGRHAAQREWIGLVVIAGLGAVGTILFAARRAGGWMLSAAAGLGLLAVLIVLRATSLHDIDPLMFRPLLRIGSSGIRLNHLLELAGIAIIAVAAIGAHRTSPRYRSGRRYSRS